MAFNTGLSGLRAASVDLDVTGNNIANASTVGFKSSRVQFGDLYSSGFLSAGSNSVGDGVRVQDVRQSFGQGNISFTDNALDMAIDGDGFFILNNGGETRYSRAGQFGVDKDGYVVNNQNMRVQGYEADDDGNLSGVRGDLRIDTDNLAPRRTTQIDFDLNLDSRQSVLERQVNILGDVTVPAAGFAGETLTLTYEDGSTRDIVIPAPNPDPISATDVVSLLDQEDGVGASAQTILNMTGQAPPLDNAFITAGGFSFEVQVDGVAVPVDTSGVTDLDSLADAINNSSANSVTASVDDATGELRLIDNSGNPLAASYTNNATTVNQPEELATIRITTDRDVADLTSDDAASAFATAWGARAPQVTNQFNPLDQKTYNYATSTKIYDSLGNSHEMTQYFVKNPAPGNGVGASQWSIYVQIDGEFVGGTDSTPFVARFTEDGRLQSINGDQAGEMVIGDWVPKDENGDPNGADGPPPPGTVIETPIPDPPTSSAFVIGLSETTQYGTSSGVNDQNQNGYTTGRLAGLDVSSEGVLFARYTNGQSQALGQVALAAFSNTDGLTPVGDTTWVETFESGQPVIGQPETGTLGSIEASQVEESNVDLSEELVNLIIAQRNYQANAKTIETSDAVTQTIINLR
ncbi:flagellar hook-basal body complex protein [Marinobacter xestospongiae]|uniref:flagellar hook-basal body complex protein n=1 Tax=Marinobacter xestospongiae TaxID=994319 RepID=UPI0020048B87|nr:flagellar hook-basal body complex protein [Marinobacter xestospongiae]MCK7565800.1 flagellar hook-basal body complex protein [Marinobacter xestospongiae]